MLRGRGIKAKLKKQMVIALKKLTPHGLFYHAPKNFKTLFEELDQRNNSGQSHIEFIYPEYTIEEELPEIFNYDLTDRFTKYKQRIIPKAYIGYIPNGLVYGLYTNIIMINPKTIAADLTREFGAYGGLPIQECSILISSLRLPPHRFIEGTAAVITTIGADNFHHWLYDSLPRIYILMKSKSFDSIDWFLISHSELSFQKQSLLQLGIPGEKIINPLKEGTCTYSATMLVVPSLPSVLGTVSPWVVNFLDNLFKPSIKQKGIKKRIFLSRKNVKTRHIINEKEVMHLFREFNIEEVFPEDYAVSEFSGIISEANFIISVHGSGLSNLCFVSAKTTVIDILAPYHQDCYYWLISNIKGAKYIGFFSEGSHPDDNVDLVRKKRDDDLQIDCLKLRALLQRELEKNVFI